MASMYRPMRSASSVAMSQLRGIKWILKSEREQIEMDNLASRNTEERLKHAQREFWARCGGKRVQCHEDGILGEREHLNMRSRVTM
jgi:hypothetical protein